MYEASKRYAEGSKAAAYLVTASAPMRAQAKLAGVAPGVVALVVQVAAMKSTGAQVQYKDLVAAGLGHAQSVLVQLIAAKRAGWLTATGSGKLTVTSSGRQLVADLARGWERSARKLVALSSALPYRKRAAKRTEDQA